MHKILSLLLLALAISCASGPTKEQIAAFNNKVEAEKAKSLKDLGPSTESRIPLKAGQWVTIHTKIKGEKQDQSLSKFKVLKVSGKTVTMEVESINAATAMVSVMQYEVENYPSYGKLDISKQELEKLVDKMDIKRIVMKQGDEPAQEISTAYMPMAKNMLKQLFSSGYRIGETKKEACTSQYLKSSRCIGFDFEASAYGFTTKGRSYAHSAVPIVGFIKSNSDNSETEVLNFGMTGATSSL